MRMIARHCLPLRLGASRSADLRLDRVGKAPAPCGSRPSRHLRGSDSASTWITLSFMDQNLCRRPMPRPKCGRSRPTTAATAPAPVRLVHLQVVGREQMAIAADIGYGHGLEQTLLGKAHRFGFGCSKARPRYHLQRIAPFCNGLPWVPRVAHPELPAESDRPPQRAEALRQPKVPAKTSCDIGRDASDFLFSPSAWPHHETA